MVDNSKRPLTILKPKTGTPLGLLKVGARTPLLPPPKMNEYCLTLYKGNFYGELYYLFTELLLSLNLMSKLLIGASSLTTRSHKIKWTLISFLFPLLMNYDLKRTVTFTSYPKDVKQINFILFGMILKTRKRIWKALLTSITFIVASINIYFKNRILFFFLFLSFIVLIQSVFI